MQFICLYIFVNVNTCNVKTLAICCGAMIIDLRLALLASVLVIYILSSSEWKVLLTICLSFEIHLN